MATTIRIIETGYPIGERLFHVFIFCLPPDQRDKQMEIIEALIAPDGPAGVYQVVADPAGVLVYLDDMKAQGLPFCQEVTERVINPILRSDFKAVVGTGREGSFFFVRDYGKWPGATTLNDLMPNPSFALDYLEGA